jgi:hypothetical protein
MATRATKTINMPEMAQAAPEQFNQRKRPELGQFRLQVDRQTKASYATFEEAEGAAIAIKKGHPKLQVAVYDGVKSINKLIELPAA